MQRIALGLLVVGLLISGCTAPGGRDRIGPPPAPVLNTRPPAPPPVPRPAPPRPPTLEGPSASWVPPGGIHPGLWKVIVVHHAGSAQATPQGMNAYHLRRGWENGLGYHFVIGNGVNYPDGQIFVGPRWQRQIQGAHCKTAAGRYFGRYYPGGYFNDHGIGICLIGDFETGQPTPKQLAALYRLCTFLCRQTGISGGQIYGHKEVTHQTLCPGRSMNVASVRRATSSALAGAPTASPTASSGE